METSVTLPDERDHAWHTLEAQEVLRAQGVDAARGLNHGEANSRLQEYGPNQFAAASKESAIPERIAHPERSF